jgi:hypothetical protein
MQMNLAGRTAIARPDPKRDGGRKEPPFRFSGHRTRRSPIRAR